jgi:hypothetical protein
MTMRNAGVNRVLRTDGTSIKVPPLGEGKPVLYGVAWERHVFVNGQWVSKRGILYLHATNQANAKFRFLATRDASYKIVAAAPVIGYFVKDNKGEKLSVE